MATLTTANSVLTIAIVGLFPVPQIVQGFAADDNFTADDVSPTEVLMGVDGKLSGGFTPVPTVFNVMLQADSNSNQIFDDWQSAQVAAKEIYIANAVVVLQGTGQKYSLTRGILTSYNPFAPGKKILQPRKFTITFETCTLSPV